MKTKRVRKIVGGVWATLLSSLAPPRCRLCQKPLFNHANPFLCPDCAASLEWIGKGACRGCGFPAGPHASHAGNCFRCRGKRLNLTAAAAVVRYRGGARSLVLALKFRGETEIARPIARLMAERLKTAEFGKIDVLLPVSLHPSRRRARGFDQADLLCRFLGASTGLPVERRLLRRTRLTRPQSTLRREDRLENMRGAFQASPATAGRSVLLVDDVMTTGATMAECSRALREAGASRVYALVFAR